MRDIAYRRKRTSGKGSGGLFAERQQRRIAARRGRIDCQRALSDESQQIMRPACFGSGAGQILAAERLHADHRADLVAIDVAIADFCAL